MKQTYTYAVGWKIFSFIFFFAVLILIGYFFVNALLSDKQIGLWTFVFVGVIAFFGYGILSIIRSKVVIADDGITYITPFKTKQLLFSEIKGYSIQTGDQNSKSLIVLSKVPGKPDLNIGNPSYFANSAALTAFIYAKFKDIDEEEYQEEEGEILLDPSLGFTEEERAKQLKRVRNIVRVLNIIGLVISFWLYLYPQPYPVPLYIALIYPFFALIYFVRNQSIVTLIGENKKKSAYPSLSLAFIIPPVALLIRTLIDFDILEYDQLFLYVGIFAGVLVLALLLLIGQSKARVMNIIGAFGFALFIGYGGVVVANCIPDRSVVQIYKVQILDRRISSSKSKSYYLSLTEWGNRKRGKEVSVASSLYKEVAIGDSVSVNIKKGMLNIPWYYITK